jgi:hypothetical protein
MKLIDREWNAYLGKYQNMWLADNETNIAADFDSDCAEGSIIIVIATATTYMKNTAGQWQKCGSTEVIV